MILGTRDDPRRDEERALYRWEGERRFSRFSMMRFSRGKNLQNPRCCENDEQAELGSLRALIIMPRG